MIAYGIGVRLWSSSLDAQRSLDNYFWRHTTISYLVQIVFKHIFESSASSGRLQPCRISSLPPPRRALGPSRIKCSWRVFKPSPIRQLHASPCTDTLQSPPTELIQRHSTALETLRTTASQFNYLPSTVRGNCFSKPLARARISTLLNTLTSHYNALAMFLSTEFPIPISLITEYGRQYAEVSAHMYFYAQLVDPLLTSHLPPNDHRVQNELEDLNTAITVPWRLSQEITDNLENAQRKLKDLLVSLKYSAEWTDEVLYGETETCNKSSSLDLLSDVFARSEELKESYSPLIGYFQLQEMHLRLLQESVIDDANSQSDTLQTDPATEGFVSPSPPAMPYPWHIVRRRAIKFVTVWRAFSDSAEFTSLNSGRLQFLEDIRVASKLEHSKRRRVSDRVTRAIRRVSSLLTTSEINAY